MSGIRGILLHICVVCSLVCMVTKILDYYNPYMDFSGHVVGFQFLLYGVVIVQELTRRYNNRTGQKSAKSKKTHYTMLNNFKYV